MFKSLTRFLNHHDAKAGSLSADQLLRMATEKRDAGDVGAAIELLGTAYSKIASASISYPVNTFLRLPLYLQEAGRADEAWKEFESLLTNGFPNQLGNPEVLPMEHSQIYDKMRLFLQRERKVDLAVKFGVLSYLSWAVGLHRQKRRAELRGYVERENIDANVIPLLKKTKKLKLKDKLVDAVAAEIKQLPKIDITSLSEKIDSILSRPSD